jgi:cobalt-zinc-cadmium efflux system protein
MVCEPAHSTPCNDVSAWKKKAGFGAAALRDCVTAASWFIKARNGEGIRRNWARMIRPEADEHQEYGHDHGHHDHGHHGHGHACAPTRFGIPLAIGTVLNVALVGVQVGYGILAHSTALLADAAHNFGDALGLVLAWGAYGLARKYPTERYTYGFRSTSILAALANAMMLLIATGAIAWEAVQRLFGPEAVAGPTVIVVAAVGIAVNGSTAWMLMAGRHGDLNIRAAYLHMLADASVSAGVMIAGIMIVVAGWNWIDPAAGLIISAVIVWGTWGLLRRSVDMSLQAVPEGIEPRRVREYLASLPGVTEVHDLHIWPMSTTETALTCHLVMPRGHPGGDFFTRVDAELLGRFHIQHPTIQIELGDQDCKLAPAHTI